MTKTIYFLDIDGTLLDEKYISNCPNLATEISHQEELGMVFALNSNRAIKDLLPVASEFNIQGPLICENGLFAYLPKSKRKIYLVEKSHLKQLVEIKKLFSS